MSKKTNRILALVALVSVLTSAVIAKRTVGVRPTQGAAIPAATRGAAIVAATAEVLKETSEIRELAILRPVKSGAQSRAAIEQMIIKNLNEQTNSAEMHAIEVSLRKFGLVPADFRYRDFIVKLLGEQVAGYYDAKAREFYLADWLELDSQKPVMAHELTHALQDQHFGLRRFEKWPKDESDSEMAAHALVEGDATLAMVHYMAKNPLEALAFSKAILLSNRNSEQLDHAPRAIRESLIFPYLQGSEWATELYKKGGWKTVSQAFTKLPASTEQIIHPEKYFANEQPVKIALPDLTSLLNAKRQHAHAVGVPEPGSKARHATSSPAGFFNGSKTYTQHPPSTPSSWRRIDYDVNGEWGYFLILDEFLKDAAESKRAAAGWAGDRYAVYEGPNKGDVLLTQMTTWDTEDDAREFYDAYVKRVELRYPEAKKLDSLNSNSKTRDAELEAQSIAYWATSEGSVLIEIRGLSVVVLEGVPNGTDSSALLRALRRQ